MAYNKSNNPLDPTGRSILTQVAFKGAIELVAAGKMDVTDVEQLTKDFTKQLITEVDFQKEDFFANLPAKAEVDEAPRSTEQALRDEFDAVEEATAVKILGEQHGPIPSWAVTQFKAAGVTKVFDNRNEIAGTKKPHFKTPKDADQYGEPAGKGFWPPR